MKTAIMQPTFIPWAGYFGLIKLVDQFVFLDDVQFDRRSWQQRNKIFENDKAIFVTVPIIKKNLRYQKILNTKIDSSSNFRKKMIKKILQNYSKSKFFRNYQEFVERILLKEFKCISDMNIFIIQEICKEIKISANFYKSSELNVKGKKTEKLVNICKKINTSEYISVEGSKNYLENDLNLFYENEIQVKYFKFNEAKYDTFYNKFIPKLSIVDLLFNCGTNTNNIIHSGIKKLI